MSEAVNEMPNFYAVIPADVRYDEDLSSTAKLLYAEISALANSKGYCFASNDYFVQLYKISKRQVITLIKKLEQANYIKVEYEKNQRKIYLQNDYGVKKSSSEGEKKFTQKGEEKFTHNNTSINNKNNNTYTPDFEKWFERYPNKFNKEQTFRNWQKAVKADGLERINIALDNYLRYIKDNNIEKRFIVRSTNFVGQKGEYKGYLECETCESADSSNKIEQTNREYEEYLKRLEGLK